jgi:hypothetical protein
LWRACKIRASLAEGFRAIDAAAWGPKRNIDAAAKAM